MAQSIVQSDLLVNGAVSCNSLAVKTPDVTDARVAPAAGIQASKLQMQHEKSYSQVGGAGSAAETKVVHVVYGATGTVLSFKAGSKTANVGAATITVDLWKNGSSILTAAISLTSATAAYALVSAALASVNLVAGDVLEVVVTVAAGGGTLGNGVFAALVLTEATS